MQGTHLSQREAKSSMLAGTGNASILSGNYSSKVTGGLVSPMKGRSHNDLGSF
jgi:hypothetical protein